MGDRSPLLSARSLGFAALFTVVAAGAVWTAGKRSHHHHERPEGWTRATHGESAPAYDTVFPSDRVLEIELEIAPEQLASVRAELARITPPRPSGGGAGGPPHGEPGGPPPPWGPPGGRGPGGPGGPGGGGPPVMQLPEASYVPATVRFNGRTWGQVGFRPKGNSSLMSLAHEGNRKLPFRLDFDHFSATHRELRDQRFYGFRELTFSPNVGDDSQLREAFMSNALAQSGVPAARTSFARVTVRSGSETQFWGLYTIIEDPADHAFLDRAFGSHAGNLYKPEGQGADWTRFDRAGFAKKNHERLADFSDVESAVTALHGASTDRAAWRTALERRFDVDGFLRWLAVNTVTRNWDAYGQMAHNYYLYADPARSGQLRWVPWDHNFALGARPPGPPGGGPPPGMPTGTLSGNSLANAPGAPPAGAAVAASASAAPSASAAQGYPWPAPPPGGAPGFGPPGMGPETRSPRDEFFHANAGERWPLISLVLADPEYRARYRTHLRAFLDGPFSEANALASMRALHALIAPAVRAETDGSRTVRSLAAFEQSIDGADGLAAFVRERRARALEALAAQD